MFYFTCDRSFNSAVVTDDLLRVYSFVILTLASTNLITAEPRVI